MGPGPRLALLSLAALSAMLALAALFCPGADASCAPGHAGGLTSSGDAISPYGPPVAIIGIGATSTSVDGVSLVEVRFELGGSGFATGDLAPLALTGAGSGVAIYRDDGDNDDLLDASDSPIALGGAAWDADVAILQLEEGNESVPKTVCGKYHWLMVLKANGTITDGDQVAAALRADAVLFSDGTTMPGRDVSAHNLTADSSAPGEWTGFSPSGWTGLSGTPDVSVSVRDTVSGLDTATAAYQYSTDCGGSWSDWSAASVVDDNGSTSAERLNAFSVQFCQDSPDQNLIRFRISDRAGNTGESDAYTVRIDTTGPGDWGELSPAGWFRFSQTPTLAVGVRDATSGLATSTASCQYSTDGGSSWSAWVAAQATGSHGTTDAQTITGASVPFKQDSRDRNKVRFRIEDLAGNTATSEPYTVGIDTTGPSGWCDLVPSGWTTSTQAPTVGIHVGDLTSGLAPGSASFQYSTDQGITWSAWAAAGVSEDGWLVAEEVRFGQDSAFQNLIRFRVGDLAGNFAESQAFAIRIDTTGPGEWEVVEPSGWYNGPAGPMVTIKVRDKTSGLAPGSACFRFSTDGGIVWSDWSAAVMDDEAGEDGTCAVFADDVPFRRDSGTLNQVEFLLWDIAGNAGRSGGWVVRTDATPPGGWTSFSPSGWTILTRTPTATVWVRDLVSGLRAGTARYQYSTDGGLSWSDWRPAVLDVPDGSTGFHMVIAPAVPFDRDSESSNRVRFIVGDLAGNEGMSAEYTVRIDTEAPGSWSWATPGGWYGRSRSPTVTVAVRDPISGLDPLSAQYQYSTDMGLSWSDWLLATVAPAGGAKFPLNITAAGVPFGQDSAELNKIRFRIADLAGNPGTSRVYTIRIDTAPPGGWEGLAPSGWYGRPGAMIITIKGYDATSGILPGRAEFQCSFDGGKTWGSWSPATIDGSGAGSRTLTAANISFGDIPAGSGRIRFRLVDLAGNIGTSEDYPVLIDVAPPGGWAGPFPGGWSARTRQPTVTVQVADRLSGLDVHGAQYRFSTDGGATWSAWRPAAVSGLSGSTAVQTVTAANVPFDQDSGTLNRIQFRVRDMAGNTGESALYDVRIDTLAPRSALRSLPPYTPSWSLQLQIDSADAASGVESVEVWYRVDGGALALLATSGGALPVPFAAPRDGFYEFFLRARDVAGNLEPMPALPDAWTTIDTLPPAIVLEVLGGPGGESRVAGHAEPGALVRINGRAARVDASGHFELELQLRAGKNTITATATDPAGNSAAATGTLDRADRSAGLWWPLATAFGSLLCAGVLIALRRLRGRRA